MPPRLLLNGRYAAVPGLPAIRLPGPGFGRRPRLSRVLPMRAVTFQAPGEVRVDERPEPELEGEGDAVVRVAATGICGSDLHIYHGRVEIEPGFVIGHEFVGEVAAAGEEVSSVAVGDHVLGTYCTA